MTKTNRVQEVYSITGQGSLFMGMGPKHVEAMQELGIAAALLGIAGTDFNRATLAHSRLPGILDGKYLGLGPGQVSDAFGFLADPEIARRRSGAWKPEIVRMNDRYIAEARAQNVESSFSLVIYSQKHGHSEAAVEMLKDRGVRLPDEIRVGSSLISHEPYLRDAFRHQPLLAVQLKDAGLLECTVLPDNLSPIVRRYGRPFQDRLVAKAWATAMAAIWHFPNQRGPADVVHALGRTTALVGLSFGVRHLLPTPKVGWYDPIGRLVGGGARGKGNLQDAIIQTREAAKDALARPEWRAIDEEINPNRQAFLAITIPVNRRDLARWRPLVAQVEHWLSNQYPFVTPLWAFGPGTPRPDLVDHSPYWVQCSLFYPIPDVPNPVAQIVASPSRERQPAGPLEKPDHAGDRSWNGAVVEAAGLSPVS